MAFLTGVFLIDAPAAALNNAGLNAGTLAENAVAVKAIRTRQGAYPYVSAQAFRYWLRSTLAAHVPEWKAAPIRRENKVAYTDGDPIAWWDDDLFGYMRAPSGRGARKAAEDDLSPVTAEITRISPFRVSTLLAVAPAPVVSDFGTMSRHEGDPVPHEHQFYHAVLKGMFSLDLSAAGTFTYVDRSGFRNLDDVRREKAEREGLVHLPDRRAYRLPDPERARRVAALLTALGRLSGGAKQTLHYTDVAPVVVLAAVFEGANNPLTYILGADAGGGLQVHPGAVAELGRAWRDAFLSKLYVGWTPGFHDRQRDELVSALEALREGGAPAPAHVVDHPRVILDRLARDVHEHPEWLA
jgi:CRISPR-associated protein Cst2